MLEEVGGEVGGFLWLIVRRLHAYAECQEKAITARHRDEREEVFQQRRRRYRRSTPIVPEGTPKASDADFPSRSPKVDREWLAAIAVDAPPLGAVARTFMLWSASPGRFQVEELAEACECIKVWADSTGALHTAAMFAEAAAYLDTANPFRANEAGRFCRRAALDFRAGIWFFRAFGLAVRSQNHGEATQALLGNAALMYHLGNHGEARRFLNKATRRARRAGQRRQAAYAQHELVLEAAEARSYLAAERHVLEALWLYPRSHPRFPHFVHDFGYLLSEKRLYSPALVLLRAALPLIFRPPEQMVVWANIARAAAGAGRVAEYREAAGTVEKLAVRFSEHRPAALSIVAVAAWLANDVRRAVALSHEARALGVARRERYPAIRAEAVLRGIEEGQDPPAEAEPPAGSQIEALTRQCLARLRKWRSPPGSGPGPFHP